MSELPADYQRWTITFPAGSLVNHAECAFDVYVPNDVGSQGMLRALLHRANVRGEAVAGPETDEVFALGKWVVEREYPDSGRGTIVYIAPDGWVHVKWARGTLAHRPRELAHRPRELRIVTKPDG